MARLNILEGKYQNIMGIMKWGISWVMFYINNIEKTKGVDTLIWLSVLEHIGSYSAFPI